MPKYNVTLPRSASQYRALVFPDQVRKWEPGQTLELELSEELAAHVRDKGFAVAMVGIPPVAVEEPKRKGR